MGTFSLTPEDLDALAKHIANVNDSTQGTLRQVRSSVEGVQSSWQGTAATAFQNLMTRFDEDARKVQEALMSICEQISSSSEVYKQQEAESEQSVSTIANRL
ncbi:WXG100 family type VII secretion target [Lentzea sp. PSKA42]|uniref:ESAT-6-like protein n=1 Tax=Lentzea indica TaxID=2604800 RepID=A0ABX1FSB5_9PSEU|nr:WXG100 family type VII secretion target [Lentzea indica]NKE61929.1 WXG100 family type VII secretion target [Lentzea indica]